MDMSLNVRETAAAPASLPFEPPMPKSIEETGLGLGFLADLAIKVMYFEGYISGYEIADTMKLPHSGVVDEVLEFLKREQFCEVKGAGGLGESGYQYVISAKGSEKAREVLDRGQYVGPAPVPLEAYTDAFAERSYPSKSRAPGPLTSGPQRTDLQPTGAGCEFRPFGLSLWPIRKRQDSHR
jgi:hypothetical protein